MATNPPARRPRERPGGRWRHRPAALLALALVAVGAGWLGCGISPNRGEWAGTFDGSVSGVVRFEIGTRGTRLTGTMEGETANGAPFTAELSGKLRDEHFYATFEGASRMGLLPIRFEGLMRGTLADGEAGGDWSCELRRTGDQLKGSWQVEQVSR